MNSASGIIIINFLSETFVALTVTGCTTIIPSLLAISFYCELPLETQQLAPSPTITQRRYFLLLKTPGINSASLCTVCSLAGQYDNAIPTRLLAPIDCSKIRAQPQPKKIYRLKEDQAFSLSLELGSERKSCAASVCSFPPSFRRRGW